VTLVSTAAATALPHVRGTAFLGLRAAAEEQWGARGLEEVARALPPDVRAAVVDAIVMPSSWLPEAHLIAFCQAVWRGPAGQSEPVFTAFVGRSVFQGWGRFRKMLLGMATPAMLAARAPELWRRDHTHGALVSELLPHGSITRLVGSAYSASDFSRALIFETFRQIMGMTRVKLVRARHTLEPPDTIAMHFDW
jgi:hypothetical protein